jgi:hypothetical protein
MDKVGTHPVVNRLFNAVNVSVHTTPPLVAWEYGYELFPSLLLYVFGTMGVSPAHRLQLYAEMVYVVGKRVAVSLMRDQTVIFSGRLMFPKAQPIAFFHLSAVHLVIWRQVVVQMLHEASNRQRVQRGQSRTVINSYFKARSIWRGYFRLVGRMISLRVFHRNQMSGSTTLRLAQVLLLCGFLTSVAEHIAALMVRLPFFCIRVPTHAVTAAAQAGEADAQP